MHIDKCSNQSFGAVTNKMNSTGMELLKRVKGKNISEFRRLIDNQEANPVNVEFFFNQRKRLCACMQCAEGYDKVFKKNLFSTSFKFVKRVLNKADKQRCLSSHPEA